MKTNLVVWDKKNIHLHVITEPGKPDSKRPTYNPREQAREVCKLLTGHITGDSCDYFIREIATIALPYDQINDQNVKNMEARITWAINRLSGQYD